MVDEAQEMGNRGRDRELAVEQLGVEQSNRGIAIADRALDEALEDTASAVPEMRGNGRSEDVIFFDGVFFKSSLKSIFFVS